MGIEHLNEKEIKCVKEMNSIVKVLRIVVLFMFGLGLLVTISPIAVPLFLNRPDKLAYFIKAVFTNDSYYITIGVCIMTIAFCKSTDKFMTIINKLIKSEQN